MSPQPYSSSPLRWGMAAVAAITIFLVVTITAILVTFVLPETYASSTRVLLSTATATTNETTPAIAQATQLELIKSESVLEPAAAKLDLTNRWRRQYNNGEPLDMLHVLAILRARLDIRNVPKTSLIEIRCYSESPDSAALIANAVAASFCSLTEFSGAKIVEQAVPSLRPARPNKPLNIVLGMMVGGLLGCLVGGLILLLGRGKRQTQPPPIRQS